MAENKKTQPHYSSAAAGNKRVKCHDFNTARQVNDVAVCLVDETLFDCDRVRSNIGDAECLFVNPRCTEQRRAAEAAKAFSLADSKGAGMQHIIIFNSSGLWASVSLAVLQQDTRLQGPDEKFRVG